MFWFKKNSDIDSLSIRNAQAHSRQLVVKKMIKQTDRWIKKVCHAQPETDMIIVHTKIYALSIEMIEFINYYVSRGFSVFPNNESEYIITWDKSKVSSPSDPRFITKGMEESVVDYLLSGYDHNNDIGFTWSESIGGLHFEDDELICQYTYKYSSFHGSSIDKYKLSTSNECRSKIIESHELLIYNKLRDFRDLLLAYNYKYGVKKQKYKKSRIYLMDDHNHLVGRAEDYFFNGKIESYITINLIGVKLIDNYILSNIRSVNVFTIQDKVKTYPVMFMSKYDDIAKFQCLSTYRERTK